MATGNDFPNTSAERIMQVLDFLSRRTYPTPTMIISQECGIPKSSLHNLLNAMRRRRFVTYHRDSRAWSLGARVFEISAEAPLLAHALAILRVFGQEKDSLDTTQIARQSELPPAVVSRIVPMLEENGLLAETPRGQYRLGLQLVALASRVRGLDQLRIVARPFLMRLRDATGETANLIVLHDDHALYVDQVESRHALRHTGWVGRRVPLENTAAGAALRGATGAQTAHDTVELGVTAVACAILGTDDPQAAVGVTGPNFRLEGPDLTRASVAVETAAHAIGLALARPLPS
jgi:IclR family transcriptional regulator, acetate operon repressor